MCLADRCTAAKLIRAPQDGSKTYGYVATYCCMLCTYIDNFTKHINGTLTLAIKLL